MSEARVSVAIIGLGYIGLPTAAVIARAGMQVTGVDVQQAVVDKVNAGQIHIDEPDLDAVVDAVVSDGRLSASTETPPADVFIIAVPTPTDGKHRPDIAYVLDAAKAIAPMLRAGDLVILESTSPIGTTEQVCRVIALARPDLRVPAPGDDGPHDISVAYCPERVLPGRILAELVNNDRCAGGITPRCAALAATFYKTFVKGEVVETDARAAEMVKLAENSFRDVNIAFANELSLVADAMGIDVAEVIRIANRHPRVNILQPGPGVGGHCIAVDPWFLVHSAPDRTPLIRTARAVNDHKADYVAGRVRDFADAHPDALVACLGVAFKADVDDFRESPALKIVSDLVREMGPRLRVVEPHMAELPAELAAAGVKLVPLDEALKTCAIQVLLVDHKPFKAITAEQLAGKLVYDTRGCLPKECCIGTLPGLNTAQPRASWTTARAIRSAA